MKTFSSLLKYLPLAAFSCYGLSSCSWMLLPPDESKIEKPVGLLQQLNAGGASGAAQVFPGISETPPSATTSVASLEEIEKADREAGIIFTDPDNPDKTIEELEEAFKNNNRTDWLISYSEANREAMAQQKPILMWFTDSRNSPTSTALSNQLLSKPQFSKWCEEHLIRLRLDVNVSDDKRSVEIEKENYMKKLCKKYNVIGFPRLFLLTPDGQTVDMLTGYVPGSQDFVKRRIVNSTRLAIKQFQATQKKLESMGYRVWQGKNGNKIFAKLIRYSEEKGGILSLQEMNGQVVKTGMNSLSVADANWVKAEKAKREPKS